MNPGILFVVGVAALVVVIVVFRPNTGLASIMRRLLRRSERVLREDLLKTVHKMESRKQPCTVAVIAGVLEISMNRASALCAVAARDEFLTMDPKGLHLTRKGRETALHIIRAHRLWERYLSEKTGFAEEEWHLQAEEAEHRLTESATEVLSSQLGNPIFDPHGDPIPSPDGLGPVVMSGVSLVSVEEGVTAKILHLEDEPETVYAQLVAAKLTPGMRIHILENSPQRIKFWADEETHSLAPVVADNVLVQILPDGEPPEEQESGTIPLSNLELGETGEVMTIASSCRGAERRRLLDLGIVAGTTIQAELRGPGGDPTAYRIRETLIALRRKQAHNIRIREVEHE